MPGSGRSVAIATVLAIAATAGCSTGARLRMHDGSEFNAYVEESPGPTVRVVHFGREYQIPRSAIGDVSHPGTTAMIVGAALVGAGVLALATTQGARCNRDDRNATCGEQESMNQGTGWLAFGVLAAPGVGACAWGTATHLGSRARFSESTVDPTARR
jgi:hypothetical protein